MKSVKQTLLERRSIRRYERQAVTDSQLALIYEAIRNTPTSYNAQQFSVIDCTDQELKERLYAITNQKQIKTCSHFLLFCADFHKIAVAAQAKGIEMPPIYDTADGLILGVVDASLAMMSALVAAEAQGLGTCCIGYARTADPDAMARELNLPPHVFVVCGLAIGVPREMPDMKPKQPAECSIHSNRYPDAEATQLTDDLLAYDNLIRHYNATRAGSTSSNDWVDHILDYYREAMNYNLIDALRRRGFNPQN